MATIQLKRQLKFAHPKSEAIQYIKTRLTLAAGEPLICTYKESNGKWGAIEVICVYPKEITLKGQYPIIPYDKFDEGGKLKENILKINDDNPEWENI
jgi:hypothetical protein